MWIAKFNYDLMKSKCELADSQEKLIKAYKITTQATDDKIEVMKEYIASLNKTIQLLEEQNQFLKERSRFFKC